eukprot:g29298.t1
MMRGTAPKAKAKASPKASPKAAARGNSPEAPAAARRPGVPPAREFPPLPGLPPLPLEALNIGEEIGKGRFKHVNRGILKGSAMKDGNEADRDIVVIRYAKGKPECTIELQVLSRCVLVPDAAEHIPRVWGAAEQGRDLVLERAKFGCLKAVVQDGKGHYSPAHGLRAATQISLGMKGLQIARVVHADLSCRNILVSEMGEDATPSAHVSHVGAQDPDSIQVKVTDFGLSCEGADHEIRKQPQATRWCAPQHCAYQKLSHKGDVWSTGTLIWEMFSGGNIPWVNWTKRTEVAEKLKSLAEAQPGSDEAFFDAAAERATQQKRMMESSHACRWRRRRGPALQIWRSTFSKSSAWRHNVQKNWRSAPLAQPRKPKPRRSGESCEEEAPKKQRNEVEEEVPEPEVSVPQWAQMVDSVQAAMSPSSRTPSTVASPEGKTLLGHEADQGAVVRSKSHRLAQVMGIGSEEMLEILHEELKEMRSKKALPQRETLIPLLGYSAPVRAAHLQIMGGTPGTWTLRTLAGPGLMRKQEFAEKEDAWQAFMYCADTAQPCQLMDPSGQSRASSGWVGAQQLEIAQQAVQHDPYFAVTRNTMPALGNGPKVSGVMSPMTPMTPPLGFRVTPPTMSVPMTPPVPFAPVPRIRYFC